MRQVERTENTVRTQHITRTDGLGIENGKNRRLRAVLSQVALLAGLGVGSACLHAQPATGSGVPFRIGVLTDMSGTYSDFAGKGGVEAVKMAVEDFGGKVLGQPIEVIYADHRNKADIASSTAREWYDQQNVRLIADNAGSATALAVTKIAGEKKRIAIVTGAGTDRVTNEDCTPYTIHYNHDTSALANVAGKYIVKRGGDTWYFVTVDYSFGYSLEKDTAAMVKANGGKVLGMVKHPFNTADFSSYIVQAQASGAKIIGLANAGNDTINAIKTAKEFGLLKSGKVKLAGLLMFINDVHALGLDTAQGLYITEGFYWDTNDGTRKWSERFFKRMGKMPSAIQAADYSSTLHYLEAVRAAGTDDSDVVIKKMKETPVNDFYTKHGVIRADGLLVHDMYLMQVKTPAQSKKPWDYYTIEAVVPGSDAYPPLSRSACPLVKKP